MRAAAFPTQRSVTTSALVVALSVALTYLLFALAPLRTVWQVPALFGPAGGAIPLLRAARFNFVYLPTLAVLLIVALRRKPRLLERPWTAVMSGVAAGYIAGLVAYPATSLFARDGFERLLRSLQVEAGWIVFILAPVWMMAWFFGGVSGATACWLGRTWRRSGEVG